MIPAQAVEAAAKQLCAAASLSAWEDHGPLTQESYRTTARLALMAAAPHIAGAWHDAVSEAYVDGALSLEQASVMWNKNPYRTPDAR